MKIVKAHYLVSTRRNERDKKVAKKNKCSIMKQCIRHNKRWHFVQERVLYIFITGPHEPGPGCPPQRRSPSGFRVLLCFRFRQMCWRPHAGRGSAASPRPSPPRTRSLPPSPSSPRVSFWSNLPCAPIFHPFVMLIF